MKVFRGLPNAEARAPCALTIGNFDGVHRGHQALIARMREAAAARGLDCAVMTFEPHPREFFAERAGDPTKAPPRIAGLRDKLQSLSQAGVDRVIVEHFNAHLAALSPEDFVEQILVQGLHAKWIIVGEDFCYGARRGGNLASLIAAGRQRGFEVEALGNITAPLTAASASDGAAATATRISSSAVRLALAQGDFTLARELLGHDYRMSGHVVHGAKLGRTLGFPTLNLRLSHKRPVLSGIYVVQVHGLASKPLPAVASIGVRPTVDDSGRVLLETHVFDFDQQCYGKLIQVEFLQKLRDEQKYGNLASLTEAIANDAAQARTWFRQERQAISATDRI
ncbi:MAG: bifunctional riboflavin kinase/FAD synthetase [Janthinobacterium lividum]